MKDWYNFKLKETCRIKAYRTKNRRFDQEIYRRIQKSRRWRDTKPHHSKNSDRQSPPNPQNDGVYPQTEVTALKGTSLEYFKERKLLIIIILIIWGIRSIPVTLIMKLVINELFKLCLFCNLFVFISLCI